MDFLSELTDVISATGRDVTDKAKKIKEIAKINTQITAEESKRHDKYAQLGKEYFDLIKYNPPESFKEIVADIQNTLETETALKAHLCVLKGLVTCSSCGKEIPVDYQFCPNCGAKNEIPTVDAEVVEEAKSETEETEEKTEE